MTHPIAKTIFGYIFKKWYLTYNTALGEIVVQRYRTEKEALSVGDKYAEIAHGENFSYVVMYNMVVI